MKILVINSGSSSLKCILFEMPERRALARCDVEKIGEGDAVLNFSCDGADMQERCDAPDIHHALDLALRRLLKPQGGPLDALDEIAAFGHRVVHGGTLSDSMLVDDDVLEIIRRNAALAPLHNPSNLAGLTAAMEMAPGRPQVAVFDTAFHAAMPPEAYLYAVPYSLYAQHDARAYGFHGTSHHYVALRAAEMLEMPFAEARLITIHLGNGCSMAAVKGGRSVDTSMGMTPLEGLVMGTRSGDVDPALFLFMGRWLDLDPDEVYDVLNRQSGLLGLSGVSNDMREVIAAADAGNERAGLALDLFAYRIRKYIGAYFAVLGRVDGIVFTAGIGENSPRIRAAVCRGLDGLGIALVPDRNEAAVGREADISAPDAGVATLVVPTDEALMIALETCNIVQKDER